MQDAYGGIMNLVLLAIFLLLVSGILGLTVSYTKAFKMKNIVISNIERYEDAKCTVKDSACNNKIIEQAKGIAYSPSTAINCHGMDTDGNNLYCYSVETKENGIVYTIITQVDVGFPIIDKVAGFRFFQVSGKTRLIKKPD